MLKLPPPRRNVLREYRVATWFNEGACPVDREILGHFQNVIEALRREGVAVHENVHPAIDFAKAHRAFETLLLSATSPGMPPEQFHQMALQAAQLAEHDDGGRAGFLRSTTLRHRDWLMVNEAHENACGMVQLFP